jgi:antitoxin CptB
MQALARYDGAEMHSSLDPFRKKLLWRATHRGIKEMDIVVGGFAETHLASMNQSEIKTFQDILEIADQDLLGWMTRQSDIPADQDSQLLRRMLRLDQA